MDMMRKTKIIVIDHSIRHRDISMKMFEDLLGDKIQVKVSLPKEDVTGRLKGDDFDIRFLVGINQSIRGMRGDYVINNINDSEYHSQIVMSMTGSSKFRGVK